MYSLNYLTKQIKAMKNWNFKSWYIGWVLGVIVMMIMYESVFIPNKIYLYATPSTEKTTFIDTVVQVDTVIINNCSEDIYCNGIKVDSGQVWLYTPGICSFPPLVMFIVGIKDKYVQFTVNLDEDIRVMGEEEFNIGHMEFLKYSGERISKENVLRTVNVLDR